MIDANPRHWISSLRSSQDRLASVITPLQPMDLERQSYDPGWSIAQVLSHMGSQAELFMVWVNAAVEGTDPPGQESMKPAWDA